MMATVLHWKWRNTWASACATAGTDGESLIVDDISLSSTILCNEKMETSFDNTVDKSTIYQESRKLFDAKYKKKDIWNKLERKQWRIKRSWRI